MTTREDWLIAASAELLDLLGYDDVSVRVSVGFPSTNGLGLRKRRVGECWKPEATKDGIPHVFVSPLLEEPEIVLSVLAHELIHAKYPEAKHKGVFITEAKRIGLEPPWTGTTPGDELLSKLKDLAVVLGAYPHTALVPTPKDKPQTTRMLKCTCPTTGYLVRLSQKWIDEYGPPFCPCCTQEMKLDESTGT